MTLVATVLLSAIAATIALVLVRQTVLVARAETVRGDVDTAYQAALAVKVDFERQLAADPQFYLKQLFAYERPRICGSLAVIPPESPALVNDRDPSAPHNTAWPDTCPKSWDFKTGYLDIGNYATGTSATGEVVGYNPSDHPVRVELSPPSPTRPTLMVKFLASKGQTETGLIATYRPASATALTAYSQSDLRLDALYTGADAGADLSVRGTLYAGGQMYLPTASAEFNGAQLFAESGFVGTVPATGRFYAAGANATSGGGAGVVRDIRQVVPNALSMEGLRGSYGRMEQLACSAGVPTNLNPADYNGVSFSSSLCLRYGKKLAPSTAGESNTVSTNASDVGGAAPAAYLLKFSGTPTAPKVQVWTARTAPSQTGECLIQCDLVSLARKDFDAHLHPASAPAPDRTGAYASWLWQPLGEYAFPASGVIMTDADTYVGQTPAGITGSTAADQQAPTVAQRSVTIVAGSPSQPKDLILGGSVLGAKDAKGAKIAQVGLVATRSVVVPFYARPTIGTTQGNLTVEANVVAFGYGMKAGQSALRPFPATQAPQSANRRNYGDTFTLTGSIAAPSLEAALAGWNKVMLKSDPASVSSPPPGFPAFTNTWVGQGSERLSSYAVCGRAICAEVW